MNDPCSAFAEIWLADFEFHAPPGERPTPICLVARELWTGRTFRVWEDELRTMKQPPFSIGPQALFVAYYASAELSCFLALGWPMPTRILDLFAEFRCLTNGRQVPCGNGLLGAMTFFGLDAMEAAEKDSMRDLAIRGGPFTADEQRALLQYCEADVLALEKLVLRMGNMIDIPRALLRGRYMAAAARMEGNGVPIDTEKLAALRQNWDGIKHRLITSVDVDFGVFKPTGQGTHSPDSSTSKASGVVQPLSFSQSAFADWLALNGIPWPRLDSGALDLSDEVFRKMSRQYPAVAPLRELRHALSQLRLQDLAVGSDGRNRCILSAFRARTSRNQPSNSRFIFGPSVWLRSLIRPEPATALAYLDWSAQEIGIAAALSGDAAMQAAYNSGDPYLWLAKAGGFAPPEATKQSHANVRDAFKIVYLAANYGMGEKSLAQLIGRPPVHARELLRLHRESFPTFWRWSDGALNYAMLHGKLWTIFGWQLFVGADTRPTSLRNFPVQANGAEILRLACCLATERGIRVCAPIHDALLIEGPADTIEHAVFETQLAMREASEIVLNGFPLKSEAKIIRAGERYSDPRGERMWKIVMGIVND